MSIFMPTPKTNRSRPPEGQPPFSVYRILTSWRKRFPEPQTTRTPGILTLCAGARVDPAFELAMTLPPSDKQSIRDAIAREESRLLRIEKELGEAQARLAAFNTTLARADSPERLPSRENPPSGPSTSAEKVALLRSRFRGQGVCEKPRVRCGECSNEAFPTA